MAPKKKSSEKKPKKEKKVKAPKAEKPKPVATTAGTNSSPDFEAGVIFNK
jgi:hypothetical protein